MQTLKTTKRNLLFAAIFFALIGLTCTWAIASSSAETAPATVEKIALEDLPEFAPRFQHIVARKRPVRRFAVDRFTCSWSGSRLCSHPAWL